MSLNPLNSFRAILIPIDNRPITYLFPQLVAQVAGIDLLLPPRQLMGSLTKPANFLQLKQWLLQQIESEQVEAVIICLDTLLYGGLIASRRGLESYAEVREKSKIITQLKKLANKNLRVFAQSSIMRIPNYDINDEEPEYWNMYGRKLFHWSELLHQQALNQRASKDELVGIEQDIDETVRLDFTSRRKRNFKIQEQLIKYVKAGYMDFLVLSQDDSSQFGLNVLEKDILVNECHNLGLNNVLAYAGTDEVALTLLARWLICQSKITPQATLYFTSENGAEIISNFEGQTIGQSVNNQCQATGLQTSAESTGQEDLAIIIHTAQDKQGDHIWLPGHADLRTLNTIESVARTIKLLETINKPCILCDVAYANGADPLLIESLLAKSHLWNKLYSYAGWNTTGNTIGSAISLGIARWFALSLGYKTEKAWQQAMFTRLLDDWAYQTQVRQQLTNDLNHVNIETLMQPYITRISKAVDVNLEAIKFTWPWKRKFEIEMDCMQRGANANNK